MGVEPKRTPLEELDAEIVAMREIVRAHMEKNPERARVSAAEADAMIALVPSLRLVIERACAMYEAPGRDLVDLSTTVLQMLIQVGAPGMLGTAVLAASLLRAFDATLFSGGYPGVVEGGDGATH